MREDRVLARLVGVERAVVEAVRGRGGRGRGAGPSAAAGRVSLRGVRSAGARL